MASEDFINVTGTDRIKVFPKRPQYLGVFTVVYDLRYGTDAVFNVGESALMLSSTSE
jgi:hypothetical protein